jgi:hypothetical protein
MNVFPPFHVLWNYTYIRIFSGLTTHFSALNKKYPITLSDYVLYRGYVAGKKIYLQILELREQAKVRRDRACESITTQVADWQQTEGTS